VRGAYLSTGHVLFIKQKQKQKGTEMVELLDLKA
jgi:hypothetical protein